MLLRSLCLFVSCALLAGTAGRAAEPVPAQKPPPDNPALRVIILANPADPDSLAIARHYAERRGVPEENIVSLTLSVQETITRDEFDTTLYRPLQDELVRRDWIHALPFAGPPPRGADPAAPRPRYVMLGHRISYLVVCRGVPLRVAPDATRPPDSQLSRTNGNFGTNAAAVDSELALLAKSGWPIGGFVPNPLYGKDQPTGTAEGEIVKIGRLDGPTAAQALHLVDLALAGEETGPVGRGYIDVGGPFPDGDKWMEEAGRELQRLGFDTAVDRDPHTMPPEARFDAPIFYFGWYGGNLDGPFGRGGFRFPPGAIALHLYSFSAQTLHEGAGWAPSLLARGVTGTFGNVYEPFLQFTHGPQLVIRALAKGWTLGDAAAFAIPGYSWMGVMVGDPLYRPFKVDFDTQWQDRAKLPPERRVYVVMRRMRLLDAAGQPEAALATGREALAEGFSLPLALTMADLQAKAGDRAGAKRTLAPAAAPEYPFRGEEAALLAEAATRSLALGEAKLALQLWQKTLGGAAIDDGQRLAWLKPAATAALAAGDGAQSDTWDALLKRLTPAPPPGK